MKYSPLFFTLIDMKITKDEYVDIQTRMLEYSEHGLRIGQSYMNALFDIRKDLCNEVTNTPNDCSNDDRNLVNLLTYLLK